MVPAQAANRSVADATRHSDFRAIGVLRVQRRRELNLPGLVDRINDSHRRRRGNQHLGGRRQRWLGTRPPSDPAESLFGSTLGAEANRRHGRYQLVELRAEMRQPYFKAF